jgi:hypothetical protein
MLTQITFKFQIKRFNGTMGMSILSDGKEVLHKDYFDEDYFEFTTEFIWPGTIEIKLFNKGMKDTHLDDQGNILNDKHITLKELIIDKIAIDEEILRDFIVLDTGSQLLKHLYWGFNGTVKLNFDEEDFFLWFLNQKSKNFNVGSAPSATPGKLE